MELALSKVNLMEDKAKATADEQESMEEVEQVPMDINSLAIIRGSSGSLLSIYTTSPIHQKEDAPFDTDSSSIGIDNRCLACITHVRSDIPGELQPRMIPIKGFGGRRHFQVWKGTIH